MPEIKTGNQIKDGRNKGAGNLRKEPNILEELHTKAYASKDFQIHPFPLLRHDKRPQNKKLNP